MMVKTGGKNTRRKNVNTVVKNTPEGERVGWKAKKEMDG
jgi:hypothetical protein